VPAPPAPQSAQGDSRRDYTSFNSHWEHHDIPLMYLGNSYGNLKVSEQRPMVYLMTYHGSKGLDFDVVILPRLNDGLTLVARSALLSNPDLERRLLFVAVTRSKRDVFLSHSTPQPHALVRNLPGVVRIDSPTASEQQPEEFF
jgi:superfamily I DNA/RNA helicase